MASCWTGRSRFEDGSMMNQEAISASILPHIISAWETPEYCVEERMALTYMRFASIR